MTETWRDVLGFEGFYEVSDLGNVRSSRPGKLIVGKIKNNGYREVTFCIARVQTSHLVHKLVLQAFVGPRPPGMHGRHGDNVRNHNALSNLCWGTPKQNQADRIQHGTDLNGEAVATSKLTNEQVRQIKRRYSFRKVTHSMLADEFGVCKATIAGIIEGRNWKSVTL